MRWPGYAAFYYEAFPIDKLTRVKFPPIEGIQTGGMKLDEFLALKENIREKGLINPIIVENDHRFRIAMGYNRVEVMQQLGYTHIKAVVLVRGIMVMQPGHEGISNRFFEERMAVLHPGDETWRKSQWADRVLKSCKQEIEEAA